MPHLTLEYSNNLSSHEQVLKLLKDLHETIGNTESVDIETLKSRLIAREDFFIGADASRRAFLFARLEILPGRSEEWKKSLGKRLHDLMLERVKVWNLSKLNCSTNLEIKELNDSLYFRTPPPKY